MFTGTVNYKGAFPGVEFGAIELATSDPVAPKAVLASSSTDGIALRVEIVKADSIVMALAKAENVATHVAKVLTFKFGMLFRTLGLVEHAFIEEQPQSDGSVESTHHLGSTIAMEVRADCWKALTASQVAEVKTALEQPHHNGFLQYDLFRAALELADPLSQFMALYSIVLSLNNDLQGDVDQFILSVQPNVPTNPPFKPRSSGVQETLYTRLRNQVGHVRPGTTIQQTRAEMAANIEGLIEIAKSLIDRQP